jgi:hypothetical protein
MAREYIYIFPIITVVLRQKTGGFMTEILQGRRCRRRCVLLANVFEFFFVLVAANVIHLAQFVELAQSQASLAQIAQLRLAVVLTNILICLRTPMV